MITVKDALEILENCPVKSGIAYIPFEVKNVAASILHRVASGELAEVVHAHWTGGYTHKGDVWTYTQPQCSNCHNTIIGGTTKFCPNCGALMDGKDDSHAD